MGKQRVRIVRRNWDVDFFDDIINGDGFLITEPAEISLHDEKKKKALYGPQSPLYGTSYEDEQAFIERYRCDCGEFKGKQFEGEICPFCHTPVESKGNNIKVTGWISTGNAKFINPYYYKLLQKLLGKTVFPDIIDTKKRVDKNGHITNIKYDDEYVPLSPYAGIGIESFMDQFENILTYFQGIKKNKYDELEKLKKEKSKVFASHIPVYSTILRPQSITSDTFYYNGIDKHINPLFKLSEDVKDCNPIEKDFILSRIQKRVNKMWEFNFDMINSKDGFIRDKMLGGSLNYSARNVIIPDPTLHDNEIDLSYQTFRILFKYKIIYYLMKMDKCPLSKAYDRWRRSFVFDNYVYEVMMFIIKQEHPRILINRNPTLNYYSMLLMTIRSVKKDDSDYTLSVNLSILPGLNADQQSRSGVRVIVYLELCERLTSGVANFVCC